MAAFVSFTRRVVVQAPNEQRREYDLPLLVNPEHVIAVHKRARGHVDISLTNGEAIPLVDSFEAVELKLGAVK